MSGAGSTDNAGVGGSVGSAGVAGGRSNGGVAADPRGPVALERRYRRLLLAYPRAYRRRHATEILTTLLDAAAPGRDRPTGREARDLIVGGLRQRFRLPVGRAMVVVAIIAAVVLGALGSAVGSALGWATAPLLEPPAAAPVNGPVNGPPLREISAQSPGENEMENSREGYRESAALPDDRSLGALAGVVTGGPSMWDVQRHQQVFGLAPTALVSLAVPAGWSVDQARARLAAQGWRVGPVETSSSTASHDDGTTSQVHHVGFVATKDGTEISVSVMEHEGWPPSGMFMVQGAEPWPALPLTLIGLILGTLGGWLLTARIGYRVRRLSPWWQMPFVFAATIAVTSLGLWVPGVAWTLAGILESVGTDPLSQDGFRHGAVFDVYYNGSPLDPVVFAGLGALALLVVLTFVIRPKVSPERAAPDDAAATT